MTDFVHLHVHTDFSLLDGAANAQQLADKAASMGQKYLAITDHGNMFGVLRFRVACLGDKDHPKVPEKQIQPIIGCEFYMSQGSRHEKKVAQNDPVDDTSEYSKGSAFHIVLLATNEIGYRNLCVLTSLSYIEGFYYKPRIDDELLEKYHEGLICLSACLAGEIPRLLMQSVAEKTKSTALFDAAQKRALWFNELFGKDNFYLEIQDHGLKDQKDTNPLIIEIAKNTGIGLVVTNDVHYLNKEDSIDQDVLLCVGTQKKRSDEKRMRFADQKTDRLRVVDQFYLKSGDEMAALFPNCPEALTNTIKIAQRCKCEVPVVKASELVNYLPVFEIPNEYADMNDYLRSLTMKGLQDRYGTITEEIKERAEFELATIVPMGFSGYFLIVADFINWAKQHDIPVGPGRGSGAGSIVAYAMRITDIDPLKYKLFFERFLNPERISMPDFDVDFCEERRGEVIDYVIKKYGEKRVAQIVTMGTMKAKNAIKDVARALDISIGESNMITKLIPDGPKVTLKSAFEAEPRLGDLEKDPKYSELFKIARKLEGKNRNAGIHASGVVIGKVDLMDLVPLYKEKKNDVIATQYTMDMIEACGLVKMDFLGLATLTQIRNAEKIIQKKGGEFAAFDIEKIPEDDELTFKLFGLGETTGVFQFESEGMQNVCIQAKPNSIADLSALNALYRPGPMDNIPQFVKSKNGEQKIKYPDPSLENILKETYGVIVYQEQVMEVARTIAGYSLGEADMLRRAMGKKKMEVMQKEKAKFIAGAIKKGYTEATADRIFELLIPFAGYGFNKSHSVAYSVLAYRTMYLKAHFPMEVWAAILTNVLNKPDKLAKYIDELRHNGKEITPPCINRSEQTFTVVDDKIVYGLLGVKGIGGYPSDEIINKRKDGAYKDFMDFLDRVDIKTVGKKVIEVLILTGAFDTFGISRSVLVGNLEDAVLYAQKKKDDKESDQSSLFEDTGETEYADFRWASFPEYSNEEKLKNEKEKLGFYFSGHPMDAYKSVWEKFNQIDLSKTENVITGTDYIIVGIIKTVRAMQIKNGSNAGKKMGNVLLSDYNGEIELTFFCDQWAANSETLTEDKIIAVKGKFEMRNDKPNMIVWEVYDIKDLENENIQSASLNQSAASNNANQTLAAAYGSAKQNTTPTNDAIQNTAIQNVRTNQFFNKTPPSISLLDNYKDFWQRAVKINFSNFETAENEREYTVLGILTEIKPYQITKGKNKDRWMGFGKLTDYNGTIELTFFSDIWEELNDKLIPDHVIALSGKYNKRENDKYTNHGIVVSSMIDLVKLDNMAWKELHIRLDSVLINGGEDILQVHDYILDHSGSCSVFFHIDTNEKEFVIKTTTQLGASAATNHVEELKKIPAVIEVWRK
ncbi:MAG: DNA polymerase III subunit alpha [Termitinemataceae bacterium]|nr:MAG: DNA polymerase III subunit alpha [Termitinemataceae bacterium]